MVDGLKTAAHADGLAPDLDRLVQHLSPRWFLLRDAHSNAGNVLLQPRWAMSFLRGPMTARELRLARGGGVT